MLVCAFPSSICTRDRGCSAHPAFPAPSCFGGWQSTQSSDASRREIARSCLLLKLNVVSVVPASCVIPVRGRALTCCHGEKVDGHDKCGDGTRPEHSTRHLLRRTPQFAR